MYMDLVGKLEEKNHCEDLRIDRNIILKWISTKLEDRVWTGKWQALANAVINFGFHKM
jgi:hypothetical protein